MIPSDAPPATGAPSLWRRFTAAYAALLSHLVVVSIAILLIPVSLQIFSRHTSLIPSYIWTEEMARFLFIWMVMLGAMIGVREATHFEVDVWPQLKPRANAALRIVSMFFVLAFAFVFVYWGIKFVQFGWNQTSELADLPMTYIFIAWPLTGVTWFIFGIQRLLNDIRIVRYGPTPEDLIREERNLGTGSII